MADLSTTQLFSEQTHKDHSAILIRLLKGPLYRSRHRDLWDVLLRDQQRVRYYFQVLGLMLMLDDAEGFAFLSQQNFAEDETELPRLITRRSLTFSQTLLLVALRKRLAEHDNEESSLRLLVTRQEMYSWLSPYMPEVSNEVKQLKEFDALIKKVAELGFLTALANHPDEFEVQRIIKALVSAEQIVEFAQLLEQKVLADVEEDKDESVN